MSNNTYRAPANELRDGGRTDTALALSIATMEQQQQQRRQQDAQRQGYSPQQQVDSSADLARRQAYQSAQRLPPLQQRRSSQNGMSGGAPGQSVPDQSSTLHRTSEHRRSASSCLPPGYYDDSDPQVANRNHQRSMSHDATLPAIRTDSRPTTDAVGHVTDNLPLPTSPLTGTPCYSPNMP